MLEVVHDEQQLTVLQRLGQMILGCLGRGRRQAQCSRHRRGHHRGITDRGQIDEGHAVGEVTGQIAGHLESQPGLPRSPGPGEGHQLGGCHRRRHLGALTLPADQPTFR